MVGLRFKRGTAYYASILVLIGLCVGVATLVLGGRSLVVDEVEEYTHHKPMFVVHESGPELHNQTALGNVVLGKPAHAHIPGSGAVTTEDARWYCGHGSRFETFGGVLHKMVFLYHPRKGVHRWKTAHYMWTGTRYLRSSQWWYSTSWCHS